MGQQHDARPKLPLAQTLSPCRCEASLRDYDGESEHGIVMRSGLTLYFIRHGETQWNAERR